MLESAFMNETTEVVEEKISRAFVYFVKEKVSVLLSVGGVVGEWGRVRRTVDLNDAEADILFSGVERTCPST